METRAYNRLYLNKAMETLAVMFDYGINHCHVPAELFFSCFIASSVAGQFETGNPKYLLGLSGIELADIVLNRSEENRQTLEEPYAAYGRTREYWSGWVLAYYQWKSRRTFSEMQRNGLEITKVLAMYHPLHEADPEKFADVAEEIVSANVARRNPLKEAREQMGMTQKQFAEAADVSLRMVRAYEQKKQDLSKAEYGTVLRMARVLCVPAESLLH